MPTHFRRLRRRLAFLIVGVAAFLAVAGSAMADPTAPAVSLVPPTVSPTNATSGTFAWGASDPTDLLHTIVRYEGGLVDSAGAEPATSLGASPGSASPALTNGTHYFKVRAVESDGLVETPGPYGSVQIVVDQGVPTIVSSRPGRTRMAGIGRPRAIGRAPTPVLAPLVSAH